MATIGIYALLLVFILTWLYHDAELRGINGLLLTAIVFLTGTVPGTLLWLVFRPTLKQQPIPIRR